MREKRKDIEGLRGIAILLVILYHARVPWVSGGFVGVDVFFALSGYLITGLLWSEVESTGRVDLMRFYARRARRLLPASALTVVATLVASWALLSPLEQASHTGTALASALYLSNVWFGLNATDYLAAPPDTNPFLHLWSLAVEEQFYVAWPALLLLCWRMAKPARVAAAMTVVVAAFGLTLLLQFWGGAQWAFFGSPGRAWEFAIGGLGALAPWLLPRWIAWAGLVAIAVPACLYGPLTFFPGVAAIPPVAGTVAILMVRNPVVTGFLSARPLQRLGGLSYSWYLWHWPFLVLARALTPSLSVWGALGCSLLALGASALTYRFVEAPARRMVWLQPRSRLTLAGAGGLTLGVLAIALVWRGAVGNGISDRSQTPFSFARNDSPTIYESGCHIGPEDVVIPRCVFGSERGVRTVVLWGDSHAAQWFPALERAARDKGWTLTVITKSGCPAADIGGHPSCSTWRESAIATIRAARPDLLVIGNAPVYLDRADTRLLQVSPVVFLEAEKRTLQAVRGIQTVVLLPPPRPGFDVPMCLARASWWPWQGATCAFPLRPGSTAKLEKEAAQGREGVNVLDLSDVICGRDPCAPMADGTVVYRDDNHLTARFAAAVGDTLASRLESAMQRGLAPHAQSERQLSPDRPRRGPVS